MDYKEGVCAEEIMRSIRLNILDATLHTDAIHRGGGQVMPTFRRVCYAACLLASPVSRNPSTLVFSEEQKPGTPMSTVKVYLSVTESFGFNGELWLHTTGQAFPHWCVLDHWDTMPGSPLDKGGKTEEVVTKIRMHKGLKPEIFSLDSYYDKL
ncbi:elongation factor 2 [Rhodocollybia butyracea]|uniref:Elongation factor 2 n=1 Tax=Rhodocollybia butyracea TaxID=206335 RepID=A0A9P5P5U3_9AGAR|nr:elongation factor 2 [Rhodocollybia butyracea]